MPRDPAGRPGCLEIKAAGNSVDVEQLSGEIKSGRDPAFHGFEIDLAQIDAAAGDKFFLVERLAVHREFGLNEKMRERICVRSRERGPARFTIDPSPEHQLFPQASG